MALVEIAFPPHLPNSAFTSSCRLGLVNNREPCSAAARPVFKPLTRMSSACCY